MGAQHVRHEGGAGGRDVVERLVKRKVERERKEMEGQEGKKRRTGDVDDIPTFLF